MLPPAPLPLSATDRRRRVRLVSLCLVALTVLLLLVQLVVANRRSGRMVGFTVGDEGNGPGVVMGSIEPGGPAAVAGLRPGDRVVTVAGARVADWMHYRELALDFRRGEPVRFTIERDGGRLTREVRPGMPLDWKRLLVNALTVLAYLAVALLALRQQEGDIRARLLFLFSVAVVVEFVLPDVVGPLYNFLLAPAFYLVTGIQMGLEVHLASVIPERQGWLTRFPFFVPLFYVIGIGFGVVGAATQLADSGAPFALPWTLPQFDNALFSVGFPVWAGTVTLLLARQALRHPEPQKRHQAGLVLVGILPWAALIAIQLGHHLAGTEAPGWLATVEPLALFCGPVAVLVAISRYQLFDLELVVRRGLVYTSLTTVLLLLFYAALGAGGVLFSELVPGGNRVWVVAVATLFLGLVFTPLRRSLEHLIYRRFFPERLALRERLTALAAELPALGKLPLMGERLVMSSGEILGLRWATLLIADPRSGLLMPLSTTVGDLRTGLERSLLLSPADPGLRLLAKSGRAFPARQLAAKSRQLAQRLESLRAEVAVPLLSQGRLIGLLLLGPKQGGDRYLAEEMDLLNLLGQHVAIVFENARLFESATHDGLTGLLRREAILQRLDGEVQRALRYGRPLAIGLADLDHFKEVNDRFGHLTGDGVLQGVSHVVKAGLRATDHVGRYGGEEFLLLLPETDLAGAVAVAEKVRAGVEHERFTSEEGAEIRLTLSIGLASLSDLPPDRTATIARDLIAAADRSLYRAKDEGRNKVRPALAAVG